MIGNGGDLAQRLGRLGISHDLAVRCVHAWIVLVVTLAGLERAILRVVGSVVRTTDAVEDVLAEVSCVGAGGITGFEAER